MGTSSVSNGKPRLYLSYTMSCIQRKTIHAMPINIFLLHVFIFVTEAVIGQW
jgi:hypothetical protein